MTLCPFSLITARLLPLCLPCRRRQVSWILQPNIPLVRSRLALCLLLLFGSLAPWVLVSLFQAILLEMIGPDIPFTPVKCTGQPRR